MSILYMCVNLLSCHINLEKKDEQITK